MLLIEAPLPGGIPRGKSRGWTPRSPLIVVSFPSSLSAEGTCCQRSPEAARGQQGRCPLCWLCSGLQPCSLRTAGPEARRIPSALLRLRCLGAHPAGTPRSGCAQGQTLLSAPVAAAQGHSRLHHLTPLHLGKNNFVFEHLFRFLHYISRRKLNLRFL